MHLEICGKKYLKNYHARRYLALCIVVHTSIHIHENVALWFS
jgi:hypothetical protein